MQLLLPTGFLVGAALGSLVLNVIFHTVRYSGTFDTEKQLSWVLTFVACIVLTLGSVPYVILTLSQGLDVSKLVLTDSFSLVLLGAFLSYLVWDLVLGLIYYKSAITILTGYVHHVLYIGLALFSATHGVSAVFCLMFYNELPTIVLALGSMRKEWRSDILFAATFFCTRILLHSVFLYKFYWYSDVRFLWKLLLLVLPMHLYWFYGTVRLQLRKHKSRRLYLELSSKFDATSDETDKLLGHLPLLPRADST
ncbi:hypothetical protein IW146_005878 [Coemansia sp. RSA 922]|nr:hypothetical protein H4S03_007097 [Coemansia sp. S3946]KAJ2030615.1 hypothetical protein GGI08_009480 [Coemansia sp. S2]KAJ2047335.1 hypothetical protein H4S04_004506 [Coemansia sp. S16]KAJ2074755.1 hypothetical protein GGH13_001101 [Coemansia sp. S155-1]KAJ2110501.1 hypothetical protein IW146_005878 [Coemansia sp. RSA 922]